MNREKTAWTHGGLRGRTVLDEGNVEEIEDQRQGEIEGYIGGKKDKLRKGGRNEKREL